MIGTEVTTIQSVISQIGVFCRGGKVSMGRVSYQISENKFKSHF